MKVLTFTSLYPNNIWPNHGVFIKERMARFAALEDCSLKVVAPVPYFPRVKMNWRWRYSQVLTQEIRDGIEVYHPRYYITPKVGMTLYGLMMFLSVLATVKKIRVNFDFDLIDAHYVFPDGFAAVLLGWYFRKPVVISARGSDINQYANFPLVRQLLRYTLGRAQSVIAVCQALKDAMIELGIAAGKIIVIPNGVDHEKFFAVPQAAARTNLGLPADTRIILSVGGLVPRKGFDVLIKALSRLAGKNPTGDFYLAIVGDGPLRAELEQLAASLGLGENVRLVGSVPHEQLNSWYSAADLFCLVSDREGWPNVLLESLACGTPVVATNIWGVPEIIRSDSVGLLTERTEQAVAATLARAFETRWVADDVTAYAKQHSWARAVQSVHGVFKSALAQK
jgi:teichuronic acid biosynthesis glycosyltransferase TuaC